MHIKPSATSNLEHIIDNPNQYNSKKSNIEIEKINSLNNNIISKKRKGNWAFKPQKISCYKNSGSVSIINHNNIVNCNNENIQQKKHDKKIEILNGEIKKSNEEIHHLKLTNDMIHEFYGNLVADNNVTINELQKKISDSVEKIDELRIALLNTSLEKEALQKKTNDLIDEMNKQISLNEYLLGQVENSHERDSKEIELLKGQINELSQAQANHLKLVRKTDGYKRTIDLQKNIIEELNQKNHALKDTETKGRGGRSTKSDRKKISTLTKANLAYKKSIQSKEEKIQQSAKKNVIISKHISELSRDLKKTENIFLEYTNAFNEIKALLMQNEKTNQLHRESVKTTSETEIAKLNAKIEFLERNNSELSAKNSQLEAKNIAITRRSDYICSEIKKMFDID